MGVKLGKEDACVKKGEREGWVGGREGRSVYQGHGVAGPSCRRLEPRPGSPGGKEREGGREGGREGKKTRSEHLETQD